MDFKTKLDNYIDIIRSNFVLPITQPMIDWFKKILKIPN